VAEEFGFRPRLCRPYRAETGRHRFGQRPVRGWLDGRTERLFVGRESNNQRSVD
jgi:transposase